MTVAHGVSTRRDYPVAIIGSGNIGTDLMIKILRSGGPLRVAAMVGIDAASEGLAQARRFGVPTTPGGIDGLLAMPEFSSIRIVFDAATDSAHQHNRAALAATGVRILDLTPAAIGPYSVPAVNLDDHLDAPNLNMVTSDGQATVPIVAAVAACGIVSYAEVVSSISSRSADTGTRAGLDTFIETTSTALQSVGGARRGKAIMVLNPADPPVLMRNTVYCLVDGDTDRNAIESSITDMVARVNSYVPGYRLKQRIQFETFANSKALYLPDTGSFTGTRVTAMLEVAGAADYLPAYAGNLDIMTAAARATAERVVARTVEIAGAAT
ncbi:acetaldehyde dehydrogenase [Mycobacterium sp. MAA66]|uniref:acetaldehyde dehydrogenase (acetylating) n=1 Tax=Mycobacterium sp. MAA66 TaxID=3156297 RepID=UPI003515BA82